MKLSLINHGSEGELLMDGRLDTNTAPEAEEVFNEIVERFDVLTLNMASLDYVSSAGLRALKRVHMAMRRKGGELILTNVNKNVMEVFEMTGFAGLLKFA